MSFTLYRDLAVLIRMNISLYLSLIHSKNSHHHHSLHCCHSTDTICHNFKTFHILPKLNKLNLYESIKYMYNLLPLTHTKFSKSLNLTYIQPFAALVPVSTPLLSTCLKQQDSFHINKSTIDHFDMHKISSNSTSALFALVHLCTHF